MQMSHYILLLQVSTLSPFLEDSKFLRREEHKPLLEDIVEQG